MWHRPFERVKEDFGRGCDRAFAPVSMQLKICASQADAESAFHRSQIPADDLLFVAASEKISAVRTKYSGTRLLFVMAQKAGFSGLVAVQMHFVIRRQRNPAILGIPRNAIKFRSS